MDEVTVHFFDGTDHTTEMVKWQKAPHDYNLPLDDFNYSVQQHLLQEDGSLRLQGARATYIGPRANSVLTIKVSATPMAYYEIADEPRR